MIDDGETFINKFGDDSDYQFDGLHLFEDPDNPKRKMTIDHRIFIRTERFKFAMRQRCARRQLKKSDKDLSIKYKYAPESLEELQAVNYG